MRSSLFRICISKSYGFWRSGREISPFLSAVDPVPHHDVVIHCPLVFGCLLGIPSGSTGILLNDIQLFIDLLQTGAEIIRVLLDSSQCVGDTLLILTNLFQLTRNIGKLSNNNSLAALLFKFVIAAIRSGEGVAALIFQVLQEGSHTEKIPVFGLDDVKRIIFV